MSDLREAYRKLDPAKPLSGDLIQSYYVSRPADPFTLLAEELKIQDGSIHILVVGQRGVGKTTELFRLARAISDPSVLGPVDVSADNPNQGLAYAVARLAYRLASLAPWGGPQVEQLKHRAGAISAVERTNSADLDLTRALFVLEEFVGLIRGLRTRTPVLLLDGCERLPSEELFELLLVLSRVPGLWIVVAPMRTALSPRYAPLLSEWDRPVPLPAISVFTRDGQRDEAGWELLRSVIAKRVGEDAFQSGALDLLIPASAGIHRDLLTLAQQACLRAAVAGKSVVTGAEAQAAVEQRRQEYSFSLTPDDLNSLRHIEGSQSVYQKESLVSLVERNLIVSYSSDWTWFGVHPIVRPLLKLVFPEG
jgi:hypothetical protein